MQINHRFPFSEAVIVVSGLPRSGTSMMMQLLQAGGIEILTDGVRQEDESNPRGYLEFERVKRLKNGDRDWLDQAKGKAVKVISSLLEYLPPGYQYKIIFIQRNLEEVLASQKEMLAQAGKLSPEDNNDRLALIYKKHLIQVSSWLSHQDHMAVIYVNYNQTIANPQLTCQRVAEFLGLPLDVSKMVQAVTQELYRARKPQSSI